MNFFAQQEHARKLTFRLVVLLLFAVITLICLTALAVASFMYFLQSHSSSVALSQTYGSSFVDHVLHLFQSKTFFWITAAVSILVLSGSFYKHIALRQGGGRIALSLGGRLVQSDTLAPLEKRLVNVVEEMSIASGSPMPNIYVLPEMGINAFAAGYNPQSAIIGITQGALEKLSRDELQGVIAHEFSHIHNGDMRLNLKLISILHGILLIGLLGQMMTRGSFWGSSGMRKSRDNRAAILGLLLVGIGYGGTFFGNLIKAAVSRQREFLADAAAVQFTRNPLGSGGALHKIAKLDGHAIITHPRAEEYSHMYFARALTKRWADMFATHPPTGIRIQRIFPKGAPDFTDTHQQKPENQDPLREQKSRREAAQNIESVVPIVITSLAEAIQHAGENFANSSNHSPVVSSIPTHLIEAAHTTYSARAVLYALLVSHEKSIRDKQIERLKSRANPRTFSVFQELYPEVKYLDTSLRIPLMEICLPTLTNLSRPQQQHFESVLNQIMYNNPADTLFSWCVYLRIINHNVDSRSPTETFKTLKAPITYLLFCVANLSDKTDEKQAFSAACKTIWPETDETRAEHLFKSMTKLDVNRWSKSLNSIRRLRLLSRPLLLKAVARAVEFDNKISQDELDCYRLVASILDCPIPPVTLSKN